MYRMATSFSSFPLFTLIINMKLCKNTKTLCIVFSFKVVFCYANSILFEDFEATKKIFCKEIEIISQLYKTRVALEEQAYALSYYRNTNLPYLSNSQIAKKWFDIFNSKRNVSTAYSTYNDVYNDIRWIRHLNRFHEKCDFGQNLSHELSEQGTIEAASAGLLMLQETYVQNISKYSKGYLDIKTVPVQECRQSDALQMDDLILISFIAMNYLNVYDSSLKFLKEAMVQLDSKSQREDVRYSPRISNIMMKMKDEYPYVHNDIFHKKLNSIGPGWKLFPFTVSPGKS